MQISKQNEILQLEQRIRELEEHNQVESSHIKELNESYISYESKRIDWERKQADLSRKNSWLEQEAKATDTRISSLVKEVNKVYKTQKLTGLGLNKSVSMRPIELKPEKLEVNFDMGQGGNTQDTRVQTMETFRLKEEFGKRFFSTYSGKGSDALLTHRKEGKEHSNLKTHRQKNVVLSDKHVSLNLG